MVFEYLTILISVVIGLALTHLLTNLIRIIHNLEHVKPYWVHLMWSATIVLWTISYWWFTFSMSTVREWTLGLFAFVMIYAVLLYVLMALLFPEDIEKEQDYEQLYFQNQKWFFTTLTLFLVLDLLDFWIRLQTGLDIVTVGPYAFFIGPLIVLSGIAIFTKSRLFHAFFAVQAVVWVTTFMVITLPVLSGD